MPQRHEDVAKNGGEVRRPSATSVTALPVLGGRLRGQGASLKEWDVLAREVMRGSRAAKLSRRRALQD